MWPTVTLFAWQWIVAWTVYAVVSLTVLFFMRRASVQLAGIGDNSRTFPTINSLAMAVATFMRQACPQLLIAAISICLLVRLWLGDWSYWDAIILVATIATWPVQEWLVHKLLLHLRPIDIAGRKLDLVIAIHHREHHKNPWDPILGITPAYIILAYVLLFIPVWLLLMPPTLALTLAIVFFGLALNYEWLHYLIHTSYVPQTAFYKRLWKNHRLHHFKNENYWYGVTMLEGDALLGTQPTPTETPRSETCLNIAPDADAARYTGA